MISKLYKISLAIITMFMMQSNILAETITFESISSGTFVRDQFQNIGVRITGSGEYSGKVYSEGEVGIENFGNSSTQTVHIGEQGTPTTILFVDPDNPSDLIGAISVSFLVGDGDTANESFIVTYFDINGEQLHTPIEYTTYSTGISISETILTLGGIIGSVQLEHLPNSESGACFDDLSFTLASMVSACETDTDGDGIIDKWDKCPNTLVNSWVNKDGCASQGLYTEAQMDQMVRSILSWGDINNDKKIDLLEAIHALRVTSGVIQPAVK